MSFLEAMRPINDVLRRRFVVVVSRERFNEFFSLLSREREGGREREKEAEVLREVVCCVVEMCAEEDEYFFFFLGGQRHI